jgi:hypothetical protein
MKKGIKEDPLIPVLLLRNEVSPQFFIEERQSVIRTNPRRSVPRELMNQEAKEKKGRSGRILIC